MVVIGGGVIGTACAYFFMRAGWRVTLIERGQVGRGSSHGNCGLICPSHVLPLAEPGMVAKGLKSLFQRNSPFAIKPRLDPAFWSWLLHFAARCNEHDMIEAGRGIQPLLLSSLALYRELIERESLDCEFESRGLLFAYRSKEGMEAYAATDRLMSEAFHCPARRYDGDALLELEPALRPGSGRRLVLSRRRPPSPRQADASLAARPRSRRSDDPRELRLPGISIPERPRPGRGHARRASSPPTCSSSPPVHGRRS